ncbi:MAG TPA: hypothetical protein VFD92_27850 [Candidatus Binatia bacterium]|nr:hypothetical protein [Candidatus Binatia bacterium]
MAERRDEFYVGYAAAAPPGIARVVRRAVVALACATIAVALALVLAQGAFAPAAFELDVARSFRGTIRERPVPVLAIRRPGTTDPSASVSSFLLVAPWKRGAEELVRGRDGQTVELAGSLLYRDGATMIQVRPGSIAEAAVPAEDAASAAPTVALGRVELRGEIVDTKCHLGAMSPGEGKTHRECAARCISGGIPPALRVRDASGETRLWLLVGSAGEPINDAVLPFVAEPVRIAGLGERRGDLLFLYADPSSIRRLGTSG